MLATLISTAVNVTGQAVGHEERAPLIAEPWVIGVVMFAIFVALMFTTMAFKSLGRRHEPVEEHADPHRQHPNKHDRGQGH
ncbi:hypothetical protein [Sinomonas mesophila]|uniref:hypothetical protein n=1 Tax=Sinomonas mesophila TaxID=1531955 RepID=UPI0009861877|nr:hypothetical protein [Sinomonas mesophila]